MKYKVGDRVKIKSLGWYNDNKNEYGIVELPINAFVPGMSQFCGKVVTIEDVFEDTDGNTVYYVKGIDWDWTDEMFEGLVEEDNNMSNIDKLKRISTPAEENWFEIAEKWEREDNEGFVSTNETIEGPAEEETKPKFKVGDKITNGKDKLLILNIVSDKYIVEDNLGECGTLYFNNQDYWKLIEEESKKEVIAWMPNGKLIAEKFNDGTITTIIDKFKYNKLSINSEFCDDKVELVISPDFELKQEGDKWFAIKKQKEYPKTYEECCKILDFCGEYFFTTYEEGIHLPENDNIVSIHQILKSVSILTKLLICRDAYWKLYGEEMRLGKPWEPDWTNNNEVKFIIGVSENEIIKCYNGIAQYVLAFPTEETRDTFYENFKELIEKCKNLL